MSGTLNLRIAALLNHASECYSAARVAGDDTVVAAAEWAAVQASIAALLDVPVEDVGLLIWGWMHGGASRAAAQERARGLILGKSPKSLAN